MFIIRKNIEGLFEESIGFQEKKNLPDGFACPDDRAKPWRTGHALLSCKGALNGGFVVINADDYYGKDAYRQMSAFLESLEENTKGRYAMAGFLLTNTLRKFGGVTRGLCVTDKNGDLTSILET